MKKSALIGATGALLFAALPVFAQSHTTDYPDEGVMLGQGWNAATGNKTSNVCIEFREEKTQSGQQVNFERQRITDRYTLAKALDISAEAHIKSLLGASVNAKSSYASKVKIDESSLVLNDLLTVDEGYIYVAPATMNAASHPANADLQRVAASAAPLKQKLQELGKALAAGNGGNTGGASLRLAGWAAALLHTDPNKFRTQCGDSFVSAVGRGGEMALTYTFAERSRAEQEKIAASLSVSTLGGSASASLAQSIASSGQKTNLSISLFKQGGKGDPTPVTLEDADNQVRTFTNSVAQHPFNQKIVLLPYKGVAGYEGNGSMAELKNYDAIALEHDKAESLYKTVSAILEDLHKLKEGAFPAKKYLFGRWGYELADLYAAQQQANAHMQKMENLAKTCLSGNTPCPEPGRSFDDLHYYSMLPLPMDDSSQSVLLNQIVGAEDTYRYAVVDFWARKVNKLRCDMMPTNPRLCINDGLLDQLAGTVKVKKALFSLQNAQGQCLTWPSSGNRAGWGECPARPDDMGFYFSYEATGDRRIRGGRDQNRCLREVPDEGYFFGPCTAPWDASMVNGWIRLVNANSRNCLMTEHRDCRNLKIRDVVPATH